MAALTGGSVRARAYAEHGRDALALGLVPLVLRQRSQRWFGRTLVIPGLRDGLIMLGASAVELGCAAGAVYALLPATADISFLAFLGLYVLPVTAGVISTVPGGLGVFEATLLLLLPTVPPPVLLGSVLAYRILYCLLPLLLALMRLATRGARCHARALKLGVDSIRRWSHSLVAPAFSMLVSAVGATLVINGSLPLNLGSGDPLAQTIGLPILELSHLSASALGVGLLILASGVYQRIRLAWCLCICGMALAAVLVLVTGLRWALASGLDRCAERQYRHTDQGPGQVRRRRRRR